MLYIADVRLRNLPLVWDISCDWKTLVLYYRDGAVLLPANDRLSNGAPSYSVVMHLSKYIWHKQKLFNTNRSVHDVLLVLSLVFEFARANYCMWYRRHKSVRFDRDHIVFSLIQDLYIIYTRFLAYLYFNIAKFFSDFTMVSNRKQTLFYLTLTRCWCWNSLSVSVVHFGFRDIYCNALYS